MDIKASKTTNGQTFKSLPNGTVFRVDINGDKTLYMKSSEVPRHPRGTLNCVTLATGELMHSSQEVTCIVVKGAFVEGAE